MPEPTNLTEGATRVEILATRNFRYQALAWIGICGTALTLLTGLEGLIVFEEWVRSAIAIWQALTRGIWDWLFGWIGISLPKSLLALANFAFFGVLLAVGTRIQAKRLAKYVTVFSNSTNVAGIGRVIAGFVATIVLVFLVLFSWYYLTSGIASADNVLPGTAALALCFLIMIICFLWTHRFSKYAMQLFPLSLIYSTSLYLIPLYKQLGSGQNSVWDAFFILASLGAINLIFSLMLAIAPPLALRNRLIASVAFSFLFVAPALGTLGVAAVYERRGDSLLAEGKRTEALASYQKTLTIREKLASSDPDNADRQSDRALIEEKMGKLNEAQVSYQKSVAIREKQATSDPTNVAWQNALAYVNERLGNVLLIEGKHPEALVSFEKSFAIREKLAVANPTNDMAQSDFAYANEMLGDTLLADGKRVEALVSYQKSLAIRESLTRSNPDSAFHLRSLSVDYRLLGDVQAGDNKRAEAAANFQKALNIRERLVTADPGDADRQTELDEIYERLGDVLLADGKRPEALVNFEKSFAIREKLAVANPTNDMAQSGFAYVNERLGDALLADGKRAEALVSYQKSLAIRESLARSNPDNPFHLRNLSVDYRLLGDVLADDNKRAEAAANFQKALNIRERLVAADPGNADRQTELDEIYGRLGYVLLADGKLSEALVSYQSALAVREKLVALIEMTETTGKGLPGAATANALGNVAWYSLLTRNFDKALAATERARTLAPGVLWMETYRAHALLFLGRADEARAIYLAHNGNLIGDQTWEEIIAEDFAAFRKAGLEHAAFDEILQTLHEK